MKKTGTLEEKEEEAIQKIKELAKKHNIAVSYSGGKDSTVTLHLAKRAGIRDVVHIHGDHESPRSLPFVIKTCRKLDMNLEIIEPFRSLRELVDLIGAPSRKRKWCSKVFRFAPIAEHSKRTGKDLYLTGVRAEEGSRRKTQPRYRKGPGVQSFTFKPIFDWSEDDVWSYIEKYDLPVHPNYEKQPRVGCWLCPYVTRRLEEYKDYDPELYNIGVRLLRKTMDLFGLKGADGFIDGGGWGGWSYPATKKTVGTARLVNDNIILTFNNVKEYNKVKRNLHILGTEYYAKDKRITIKKGNRKCSEIRSLVERSMNCIGCGVCIGKCEAGAISVKWNKFRVDFHKCEHCLECCRQKDGIGCMARTFLPNLKTLEGLEKNRKEVVAKDVIDYSNKVKSMVEEILWHVDALQLEGEEHINSHMHIISEIAEQIQMITQKRILE
ncbi:MAG TPA: phosphoadenosine phosphosulfate reductase family protein [Methanothermobacter sp.]|nr:phosphoadenosine phosphosulfate reductase family protein [Methanothermobacter sp.]